MGHGGRGGGMPPAEVNAMTVELRPVPVSFEYVGQTAGSREVEVRARVTGILLARNFKEGGRVEKGQSLFTIDPAPFQAALLRAEADVAAAEARLDQASRNAARFKPLYAEKAVSQKDYDDAVSAEPQNLQAWTTRAYAYEKLGDKEKAAGSYARALNLNKDHEAAKQGFARVGGKMGQTYQTF